MSNAFADAIRASGLEPPLSIEPGRMIRFPGMGKGAKNKAAWCRLFDDCIGGVFGDYSSGLYEVWQSRRTDDSPGAHAETYTPDQRAEFMRQAEASRKARAAERQAMQRKAAQKATAIIKQAALRGHEYLIAKGFKDMLGLTVDDGRDLIVPMRDFSGDILGAQIIRLVDGAWQKRFLAGQRTKGAEYVFGSSGVDWLTEGFATGRSLYECLSAFKVNARVHVCFSAGNLTRIGKSMKKAFICCDNDVSETGENAAIETGHPYYLPYTKGEDLNDQWKRDGTFKTGMELKNFLQGLTKMNDEV